MIDTMELAIHQDRRKQVYLPNTNGIRFESAHLSTIQDMMRARGHTGPLAVKVGYQGSYEDSDIGSWILDLATLGLSTLFGGDDDKYYLYEYTIFELHQPGGLRGCPSSAFTFEYISGERLSRTVPNTDPPQYLDIDVSAPNPWGAIDQYPAVVATTPVERNIFRAVKHGEAIYDPGITQYSFNVNNRPLLALVETTIFSKDETSVTTKIVDKPPVPPEFEIIPYQSVKDKILLTMKVNQGKYRDNPIIVEPRKDLRRYRDIIVNQLPEDSTLEPEDITADNVEDFKINFDSDDYAESFEVFRVDRPPSSYREFSKGKKTTLENTARGTVVTTANAIIDEVEPNKKYWYTFRVVDVHGNISNPSGVVEFEMVDTGNSIFPVIEDYYFPEPEISYTKPMGRYLMIAPSSNQDSKSKHATNPRRFVDNPNLGKDTEGKIWSKKYKLRLTSKLTGKKVDINFAFKQDPLEDKRSGATTPDTST